MPTRYRGIKRRDAPMRGVGSASRGMSKKNAPTSQSNVTAFKAPNNVPRLREPTARFEAKVRIGRSF